MQDVTGSVLEYLQSINYLEVAGLVFGLLAVWFLIKENIWTWPSGIAYVIISFIIFWEAKLYADFALHFVFLILNIYGWYFWVSEGKNTDSKQAPITHTSRKLLLSLVLFSVIGIYIMGSALSKYTDAAVPYWDSATTAHKDRRYAKDSFQGIKDRLYPDRVAVGD